MRTEPAPTSKRTRWYTREGVLSLVRAAPRPEFEQAGLRVVIAAVVMFYLLWYATRDGEVKPEEFEVVSVSVVFFLFAVTVGAWILSHPRSSVPRRFVGMVADNAVTSYCLLRMGEGGAVILGVYLFVTLGNGFRYGRTYLHASQIMAIGGFSAVLWLSPFWSQHVAIGAGYLIALAIVPLYVGVLAQRITEARRRADAANEAKGRFLANVSHEMRTPLNGVIAMADVLRETNLSESQREIVGTLGTSANLLLAQIEDVLDMAKIEAGRVQIEKRPVDLAKLLTNTVKIVVPQARYKGLEIQTEIAGDVARWFNGDAHHIRQVLLNLLANAVKFTERGRITVRAAVVTAAAHGALVRFEVRDTGIGIPAAKQATIFEPFTQADDSITRVYGGTGLGTTIARQLITLMGGEIGLQSTPGSGSVFWFQLPLDFAEPAGIDLTEEVGAGARWSSTAAALAAVQPANVTRIRGARILVAEDNPTNQRVTQLILESGGHKPTIVGDGEAALDALESGAYDVALFDLSMPGVSGLEALKLYQFTTSKPIPVLILSANVTTDIIDQCQRAGCAEFIPKPIRATSLLDAIERHLSASGVPATAVAPPRSDDRPTLTVVDTPVVDSSVLVDLGRLSPDPTFVERLIRGFCADADRLVQSIRDSLSRRAYDEVKDHAHALKGGAGSVGAMQLFQFASRLEKASHDALRLKAAAWTEELARVANATASTLHAHLEERRKQSGV